jgi:hypothetical protein
MRLLFLCAILAFSACSAKKENEISPAIASAPAPTLEQKKAESSPASCGSGFNEAGSCAVHPEAENAFKK